MEAIAKQALPPGFDAWFARAVNRDDIIHGAEQLGMPLDDVIAQVIAALKDDAERLGLVGAS